MQAALSSSYTDVDEIDLWIGGLAEDHLAGVPVGELIASSMVEQFVDLAEGDRFFYRFDPDLADMVAEIDATKLSDILMRNSNLTTMGDVFRVAPGESASKISLALVGSDVVLTMHSADSDATFDLERSTDAQNWQTIATDLPVRGSAVIATDMGAADGTTPHLFYHFLQIVE